MADSMEVQVAILRSDHEGLVTRFEEHLELDKKQYERLDKLQSFADKHRGVYAAAGFLGLSNILLAAAALAMLLRGH